MLYNVSFFSQMTMLPYIVKRLTISDIDFGMFDSVHYEILKKNAELWRREREVKGYYCMIQS